MLASRARRVLANALDMVLVPTLTLLLVMVTDVVEDADDYADFFWILHVLLLAIASYLLLNGWLLWRCGQTIGKRLVGIAIVRAGQGVGESVPLWKLVLVRAWFFPLLYLLVLPPLTIVPLLDLAVGMRRDRRCLHDWLAGTRVVETKERES